jgi:hypothetical protein
MVIAQLMWNILTDMNNNALFLVFCQRDEIQKKRERAKKIKKKTCDRTRLGHTGNNAGLKY